VNCRESRHDHGDSQRPNQAPKNFKHHFCEA
jgi:hypothetical protein